MRIRLATSVHNQLVQATRLPGSRPLNLHFVWHLLDDCGLEQRSHRTRRPRSRRAWRGPDNSSDAGSQPAPALLAAPTRTPQPTGVGKLAKSLRLPLRSIQASAKVPATARMPILRIRCAQASTGASRTSKSSSPAVAAPPAGRRPRTPAGLWRLSGAGRGLRAVAAKSRAGGSSALFLAGERTHRWW
jgi:hypothetical protein